jgi:hypothetical protein
MFLEGRFEENLNYEEEASQYRSTTVAITKVVHEMHEKAKRNQ